MKSRCARPRIEALEDKCLLTASLFSEIPGIQVSITTDRAVYTPGQPVNITMTETNVSDHNIQLGTGELASIFTAS